MLAWMCAMQMQMLARAYLVYELTDRNAALLGIVSAANALPLLLLALFGGAIADRLEGKRIIQISQICLCLLALFIGLSITTDTATWYHLLGGAIIHGSLVSFMMPARQAIIPHLVGQQGISNAMALNAAGMSAATVMAPAIGGNVYAFLGADGAYYMIAGLFMLSVLLTTFLPHIDAKGTGRSSMMSDIKAGLSYIGRSPLVAVLLITAMGTTLLAMPFRFLMPVFVVDIYHRGPDDMGLLLAMMGVGTLIGSLFIAAIGQWHRGLLLLAGGAITGFTLLSLALLPFYYLAVGLDGVPRLGRCRKAGLEPSLGNGGRRRRIPWPGMERVHDELRAGPLGCPASWLGLRILGRRSGHQHSCRPAAVHRSVAADHPKAPPGTELGLLSPLHHRPIR